ncbi:MAG: UvrD-helicase domain-containing protein [Gammaproteobacteria bacterium]|nr:UvrD-helicase domain-containing protein [Gammaproteobacteria bacterium]
MSEHLILDQSVRDEALLPAHSYIVQAPAGSGKTSLLIQRYLSLLAIADKPEEILAITFTRKAAAEMRERITTILSYTAEDSIADDENLSAHDQKTLELAWQAQAQNSAKEWGLLKNPNRMQILTIDAFCARLVAAMPVASRLGGMPKLVDDATPIYKSAVNQYFSRFLRGNRAEQSLETVLLQLNNSFDRASELLVSLLGRRDQWLPYLGKDGLLDIGQLNNSLGIAITQDLNPLTYLLPDELMVEISALASYAAESLRAAYSDSIIQECKFLEDFPAPDYGSIKIWKGLRKLLLTEKGTLRSRVSVAQGFPTPSSTDDPDLKVRYSQFKDRMSALLKRLKSEEQFIQLLDRVGSIPERLYSGEDQSFLTSLFSVLKQVTAELLVEFQSHGVIDFIELTQSALRALGTDDAPSDLALIFDSRFQHILIDEFQDTSKVHMELLRKLTLGWDAQDNKSLFVVGDPMQSIYRFREADVRNFLNLKSSGVNGIIPKFLQLESNFRSYEEVVNWNNRAFKSIFPEEDNIESGQIAFSPAQAIKEKNNIEPVVLHTVERGTNIEANVTVDIISSILSEHPGDSIGVLVRSRSHLQNIIPLLRVQNIQANIDGVESLLQRQEVLDVYSLCRAMIHLADRQAWLAVLRAPWCGLALDDLEIISNIGSDNLIIENLNDENITNQLSSYAQSRVEFFLTVYNIASAKLFSEPLAIVIEGIWEALNGLKTLQNLEERDNVTLFISQLLNEDIDSILKNENSFESALEKINSVMSNSESKSVHVMTIHKAKGLEFDHVILPGLSKRTRSDEKALLVWEEISGLDGNNHLLLGNYQSDKVNPIYDYVRNRNQRLNDAELNRLLYVALSRAKKKTHFICETQIYKSDQKIVAPSGSFSKALTPVLSLVNSKVDHVEQTPENNDQEFIYKRQRIKNLTASVFDLDLKCGLPDRTDIAPEYVEYEWASETAMHVGTVVHMALHQLGTGKLDQWTKSDANQVKLHFSRVLKALGIANIELDMAVERTIKAINDAALDKVGKWILSNQHTEIESEFPISGFISGEFRNYRIDRTFVTSDGTRWIIDYKTSNHLGGNLNAFLDNELERYKSQLENYANLISGFDTRPIKLGLYFPLVQGWREWDYAN